MSFLNKTYTLDKDENYQDFLENIGIFDEDLKELIDFKPSVTIKQDGDEYILSMTTTGDVIKDIKFKEGIEFDEEVIPGIVAKTKFTFEDNVVTKYQTFEDGETIIYRNEYSGDELVTVITTRHWDGTARRYFKAA